MRKMSWMKWAALGVATLVASVGLVAAGHARDEKDQTTWLGVYTQSLTAELKDGLDYDGDGVLVNRVVPGSPADEAGIRKGDVIVSLNSRSVDSADELAEIVRSANVGQSVAVQIVRDGDKRTLTARLDARPESDSNDDDFDVPTPWARGNMPRVPEAPRAPKAPHAERFHMDTPDAPGTPDMDDDDDTGDIHIHDMKDMPGIGNMRMFEGMGHGRLGVRVQSLSRDLADQYDVPGGTHGVVVTEVLDGTPAERAGLRKGDVITRVGSREVEDSDDLVRALRQEDSRATLTVIRDGHRRTIETSLDRGSRAMILGPNGSRMRMQMRNDMRDGRRGQVYRYELKDKDNDRDDKSSLSRDDLRRQIEDLRRQIDLLQKELDSRSNDRD